MSPLDARRIDLAEKVAYNPMPEYLNSNPGPFPASEYLMNAQGSGMYHLHLRPDQVSRNIIIVGDPGRATSVAERLFLEQRSEALVGMLEDVAEVVEHRGLRSITGTVRGTDFRLTVTTSGMGVGSTEITDVELMLLKEIDLASRTRKDEFEPFNIIRLGTSGALQGDTKLGTPIIGEYCLDLGNVLHFYDIPAPDRNAKILERNVADALEAAMDPESRSYGKISPIVTKSDPGLVKALISTAEDLKIDFDIGVTVTNSGFFAPQGRDVLRVRPSVPDIDQVLARVNTGISDRRILNMEMEGGTLTGLNSALGYPSTVVCIPVAHRVTNTAIDPESYAKGLEAATWLVVEGLRRFHASNEGAAQYRPVDRQMSRLDALVERVFDEGYDFPKNITAEAINCAVEMSKRAHDPYAPQFAGRGAALICCVDDKYSVVGGCDIQEAAFPSSLLAVSGALHNARVQGVERGIQAIVLHESSDKHPVVFGAEKDLLGLFADRIPIIAISSSGSVKFANFKSEARELLSSTASYVPAHAEQVAQADKNPNPLASLTEADLDQIYDMISPPFTRGIFMEAAMQAVRSSARAFAPFSNFSVGASIIINGGVVGGANVSSSPFSTGICAERTALEIAAAPGLFGQDSPGFTERVDMLMTYVPQRSPATPCGECRQAFTEATSSRPILMFCSSGEVIYAEGLSSGRVFRIMAARGKELEKEVVIDGGLLPLSFGAKNLTDS